jgi:hypothetical protein
MRKTINSYIWDAELNTGVCSPSTNAMLTLTMKLAFNRVDPDEGAAEGMYATNDAHQCKIHRWNTDAFERWCHLVIKGAEQFWSGKFWLVNTFDVLEFASHGMQYRSHVSCQLKIVPTPSEQAHATVDVIRLDKSEVKFRSSDYVFREQDIELALTMLDSDGLPTYQRAYLHEMGHLLGLEHIDVGKEHCPLEGDTNKLVCYSKGPVDQRTLMGGGSTLVPKFALPWQKAIVKLTGKGDAMSGNDWEARLVRIVPERLSNSIASRHVHGALRSSGSCHKPLRCVLQRMQTRSASSGSSR